MAGERNNLITPDGYRKLRDEAHDLWHVKRPKIVDEVHQAALQGDRSENAEYIYGKKKLREIDKRLEFLQKRIESAKVLDVSKYTELNTVQFGAWVSFKDENGVNKKFHIVGEDETDPGQLKISWKSPIGKSLLGKKVGEWVEVKIPGGHQEFEIVSIEYL